MLQNLFEKHPPIPAVTSILRKSKHRASSCSSDSAPEVVPRGSSKGYANTPLAPSQPNVR
ncbi:conserved hypothetical protein [Ricinus communis]|uniref:Uncharacterized protein n=1 Tax=Ricinus communis TaxID=3988 RepID=B9S021_RICCO|nr:conserved hypothetical protein [Ricinus communis]